MQKDIIHKVLPVDLKKVLNSSPEVLKLWKSITSPENSFGKLAEAERFGHKYFSTEKSFDPGSASSVLRLSHLPLLRNDDPLECHSDILAGRCGGGEI